jgi:WD40 repeat protein/serine/threonine protein kinase
MAAPNDEASRRQDNLNMSRTEAHNGHTHGISPPGFDGVQIPRDMLPPGVLRGERAVRADATTVPDPLTAGERQPAAADASGAGAENQKTEPDAPAAAPPFPDTLAGRSFGDYELIAPISQGGMGVVYKARQKKLERIVALKMILTGQLASEQEVRRFYTEAEAAAQLDHPGIVPVYDVGNFGGQHYFSMGFVEGGSLADKVREGPVSPREAARLVQHVAEAVAYAHDLGIIHRDLKPGNILLDKQGQPKVTDFGLAKRVTGISQLTVTGQVLGTPSYMPPEQASGRLDQVSPLADIYSLGALLYCLLTARPPFQSAQVLDTLRQVLEQEPVSPRQLNAAVSRDLETICLKCLQKDPARRYTSACALAEDLRRYLAKEPIQARPVSKGERLWRWCKRNPLVASLLTGLILSLVLGTLLSSYFAVQARREAGIARTKEAIAEAERRKSDERRYVAEIRLAESHAREGQMPALEQQLCELVPAADRGSDLRGFEWYYLQRLCQLDLRTLHHHTADVFGIAFSPDGRRLASCGEDGTVVLWNCSTKVVERTLTGHEGAVSAVAFSPDGRLVASAGRDKSVKLWNAAGGGLALTLEGHKDGVWGVAFHPGGQRLASCSHDKTVRIWDTKTGKTIKTLTGHTGGVADVAYSPDGKLLAAMTWAGTIRIWDADSGKISQEFSGHGKPVKSLAFSPKDNLLATASDDHTVHLWDTATWQVIRTLYGHKDTVRCVAFAADGQRIATCGSDNLLKVWEVATGREQLSQGGQLGTACAFSPDGRVVASAGFDRTVKLWDAVASQESLVLRGHTAMVSSVAFTSDARWAASGSEDGTIRIWELATGQPLATLHGHTDWATVTHLAFAPQGSLLASAAMDRTVRLWESTTGKQKQLWSETEPLQTVSFSPDGRRLALARADHSVQICDTVTGHALRTLRGHTARIRCVVFSPDGSRLASASLDKTVRLWNPDSGTQISTLCDDAQEVVSLAFSPDGRRLAVAGEERIVRVWDLATKGIALVLRGHGASPRCVVFSPDGLRIATAAQDYSVKVWHATTGQETLTLRGTNTFVQGIAFSPDGLRLAAPGQENTLQIWDASPLTRDLLDQREARSVLSFWLAKSQRPADVLERVRQDPTVSAAVRAMALATAEQMFVR